MYGSCMQNSWMTTVNLDYYFFCKQVRLRLITLWSSFEASVSPNKTSISVPPQKNLRHANDVSKNHMLKYPLTLKYFMSRSPVGPWLIFGTSNNFQERSSARVKAPIRTRRTERLLLIWEASKLPLLHPTAPRGPRLGGGSYSCPKHPGSHSDWPVCEFLRLNGRKKRIKRQLKCSGCS